MKYLLLSAALLLTCLVLVVSAQEQQQSAKTFGAEDTQVFNDGSCLQHQIDELHIATDINKIQEQDFHIKAASAYAELSKLQEIC